MTPTLSDVLAAIRDLGEPQATTLLDAKQAGELLNVPASWLLAEARKDRVPHNRLGKYVRFDRDELLTWARSDRRFGPNRRTAA